MNRIPQHLSAWILQGITTLSFICVLVSAGLAVCAVPHFPTQALSQAFSMDSISPFTKDELVTMAIETKDYTVGNHNFDALLDTMRKTNASCEERGDDDPIGIDYSTLTHFDETTPLNDRYILTPEAITHLDDVYDVLMHVRTFALCMLTIAVGMFIHYFRTDRAQLGRLLMYAGGITLGLFALFGLYAVISFDHLFDTFHGFFFNEGSWVFDYDSLLICMFPIPFWIGMALIWFITTATTCLICLIMGKLLSNYGKTS